jgi:hypothetical protein
METAMLTETARERARVKVRA